MNRSGWHFLSILLAMLSTVLQAASRDDLIIADFEGNDYGTWKATGTAFRRGPARGELLAQLEIENPRGRSVASSEIEGDGPQGTLTSREFKITRRYISFRVGGG